VNVDPERVKFGIYNPLLKKDVSNLASLIASNHDKLAIADGRVVETGGRNMAAHYYSDPKDHAGVYRDTDIHLESAAAAKGATAAFEREFDDLKITKRITPDLLGNWVKRDIELLGAHAMMDHWLKAPALSEAEKGAIRAGDQATLAKYEAELVTQAVAALPSLGVDRKPSRDDLETLRELAKELATNPELRGSYHVEHETFDGEVKVIDKTSVANAAAADQIGKSLLALIGAAKESIYIHNPYVVLTEPALEALAEAGKRGVKVVFMTNSPESTDSAITQAYFLEDWPHILAKIPGSRIIVATGDQKHHSKSFVIDGVLTGISTYNADWVSMNVNSEVMALHWGEEFAQDTIESYKRTIADPAHGAVEYKIKRDEQGRALVKNGKPIVEFGPEHHVPKEKLDGLYARLRPAANFARERIDSLAPLKHAPLDPARDFVRVVQ
jgi:phosphatidylserine/phosphatidylglycerophosphate/cardiolipin synthase-like enzyme